MSEVSFFEFVARMYCHVDCMYSKYWGRQAFANNVDLDQITADCDIVSVSILISTHTKPLTLSLPQAIIIVFFANGIDPDETVSSGSTLFDIPSFNFTYKLSIDSC